MMVEGEEELEVEDILTHKPMGRKKTDPKVKFLIKWHGYGHENNTWEPYRNLKNATAALNEYWDKVAVRAAKQARSDRDGYMAPVSRKLRKR